MPAPDAPALYPPPRLYTDLKVRLRRLRLDSPANPCTANARHVCRCIAEPPPRRCANYQPSSWTDEYIQSLDITFTEKSARRIDRLKENVLQIMYEEKEIKDQLELIDSLQQLGVAYHFKSDIKYALSTLHESLGEVRMVLRDDLYATSLLFRLLRQQGLDVSEDIFTSFKDDKGCFKASLHEQTKGILGQYEASYLAKEGEHILDEAREFTTKELENLLGMSTIEPRIKEQVAYALELPLNWRIPRLHSRLFIEAYQKDENVNPLLLEFAKLDFNMVQSIHQRELKEVSRWWNDLGLREKLPFIRDRLMENHFWSVGWAFEPEFWSYRVAQTKANCLITTIDDIYDVYGTLDEVKLFTDAVDRWDANAIDELPDYMKICFLALFNTVNDTAYKVMKDKRLNIIPYLKRAWADLCKSYLEESKWYHHSYAPMLQEYLENGWISSSVHIALPIAYCTSKYVTKEDLKAFQSYQETIRWSAMIFRLCNDLATSLDELKRGDASKSIQCFMRERGVSDEVARQHIKELIISNWKALNGSRACSSSFEEHFKSVAVNIPRASQFFYQYGDGYGKPNFKVKEHIISVLIEPISM